MKTYQIDDIGITPLVLVKSPGWAGGEIEAELKRLGNQHYWDLYAQCLGQNAHPIFFSAGVKWDAVRNHVPPPSSQQVYDAWVATVSPSLAKYWSHRWYSSVSYNAGDSVYLSDMAASAKRHRDAAEHLLAELGDPGPAPEWMALSVRFTRIQTVVPAYLP